MDLWITIAQAIPDAKELADGDAQKVLAYVVAALVLAVLGLFGLLLKLLSMQKAELKELNEKHSEKVTSLEEKNDKIQERLLRYVANMNQMLARHTASTNPLDPNGGAV